MKKLCLLLVVGVAALGGCFPEGEGKDELIKPNPLMGPAGGEIGDQTAPVGPAASSTDTGTASAFPSSAQPVAKG